MLAICIVATIALLVGLRTCTIWVGPRCRRRRAQPAGDICRYCGTDEDLTIEHLIPRSRGGTDAQSNLGVSCRTCNQDKGPLRDEEYMAVRHDRQKLARLRQHQIRRIIASKPSAPPHRRLDAQSDLAARQLPRPRRPRLVQRIRIDPTVLAGMSDNG
jgi:hypothetical protein